MSAEAIRSLAEFSVIGVSSIASAKRANKPEDAEPGVFF
jgi:hypothetical protein